MKSIFEKIVAVGFLCSLLTTGLLAYQNSELQTQLAQVNTNLVAQAKVLEQVREQKQERYDIYVKLQQRNRHVPGIVLANWASNIQNASVTQRIPVNVLMSLYRIESAMVHYDRRGNLTISYAGAGGLGQIMPFWYKACPYSSRPDDLDNASVNIRCSAFILRHYLNQNDDNLFMALTAYNAGPNGVRLMKRGRDITNGYARKIIQGLA